VTQILLGLFVLHVVTAAVLCGDLLLRQKEPMATLAWLEGILFLPFFGSFLYLAFGAGSIQRKRYRRRRKQAPAGENPLGAMPVDAVNISTLPEGPSRDALAVAAATSRRPPTGGNAIRVFDNVSEMYDALADAVRGATRHVHFEF
jgi:cardiolipin synthase